MKKRVLVLLLVLAMVLPLAACGRNESHPAERAKAPETQETSVDQPREVADLTVFDGIYRAKLAHGDDDETWLRIKGYNDFIMLEYHGFMEGSMYRFWAEEFWPGEGWDISDDPKMVSGRSRIFSAMGPYEEYSEPSKNRCITLTDDGVVLNYDDDDAQYFARDDGFDGGHTAPEEMRPRLGDEIVLQHDSEAVGAWGFRDGLQAGFLSLKEDGSFSLYWKEAGKPIAVYEGVCGFDKNSGDLAVYAERQGHGSYPYVARWQWYVDEDGTFSVSDSDAVILKETVAFRQTEVVFFPEPDAALG